LRQKYKSS